jgi:hypothetical protein
MPKFGWHTSHETPGFGNESQWKFCFKTSKDVTYYIIFNMMHDWL